MVPFQDGLGEGEGVASVSMRVSERVKEKERPVCNGRNRSTST
jgi:hypothetical protein